MACDVRAKLSTVVIPSQVSVGSLNVSLSACLNDFHSGLLSKGPEESADGDHDHHTIFITIIGFGAQVELYQILRSKPLATGRPTSNSRGMGRSRPQRKGWGRGRGETHTTGGEGGPSSAAPYIPTSCILKPEARALTPNPEARHRVKDLREDVASVRKSVQSLEKSFHTRFG